MNILMLSYEFTPLGGGGAKVVDGLTRELVKQGHTVDLVTMWYKGLPMSEAVHGVNVHRVPCIRFREDRCGFLEMIPYLIFALPMVIKLIRKNEYDINHTHFIFPDGLLACLAKRITGLPYIITAHGSDVPGYNPNRFILLHKFLVPLWKYVTKAAHRLVFPSQYLKELALKTLPNLQTTVIPNGFDVSRFKAVYPKKDRILLVSRMFERKGVQHFLRALLQFSFTTEVHIVGDGPYFETIKAIAGELTVPLQLHGYLDNQSPELRDLFETSKIFVFTSSVENFPVVLLEAMAAGMAIITTKGTGCEEVVGDAALLVSPEDPDAIRAALTRLLNDNQLCEKLGKQARERFETYFSWKIVAQQYLALYRESREEGKR